MYIGPWQEYRLAKIQDDAIQRLRKEWEDQLREQIPGGDDARIRELMQPMMAKLPSLLLASKSKSASSSSSATRRESASSRVSSAARAAHRPASSHSVASDNGSTSTNRRLRDEATASTTVKSTRPNNQETHDKRDSSCSASDAPEQASHGTTSGAKNATTKKKKTKKTPQLSALEEVQRRKKMFAKWIKTAATTPCDASDPASDWDFLEPYERSTQALDGASVPPDLDDSLDEDEVNNLLSWTDALLSPTAMDASFPLLDDDDIDTQ